MKGYWFRVAVAWLLLKCASSVMKDAEKLLRKTTDSKTLQVVDGTAHDSRVNTDMGAQVEA